MNRKLLATTTIAIHATPSEVWKALVEPEIISQYMHGTNTTTDWQPGSPITWSGEYLGKPYIDKGNVLEIIPERVLSYSYWSSLSATDDFEDNYSHVTYQVSNYDEETTLLISQDNLEDEEQVMKAEENWMAIARNIKNIVERNSELNEKK